GWLCKHSLPMVGPSFPKTANHDPLCKRVLKHPMAVLLIIEGKYAGLRAKTVNISGHLPRGPGSNCIMMKYGSTVSRYNGVGRLEGFQVIARSACFGMGVLLAFQSVVPNSLVL